MKPVPVLVLNWNGRHWLESCLSALLAQAEVPVEPIVVDNASTDDSIELIEQRFPSVAIIGLERNLGYGAAYNRAIASINAEWFALLNNDTVVQPGWLAALVGTLETGSDIAAAGSKLLQLDRQSRINHAGGRMTVLGSAFDIGLGEPDGPTYDTPGITGCVTGAAMLIRREAFVSVGGFDEHYVAFFDDVDLCWRFWLRGHQVAYAPAARVLHAYGGSSGGTRRSPLRIQYCQTNRLQNMFKNLELHTLLSVIPASLAYDTLRLAGFLRARNPSAHRAYVRGLARFLHLMPAVLAERSRIQPGRAVSDAELFARGVMVGVREGAREWRRLEAARIGV